MTKHFILLVKAQLKNAFTRQNGRNGARFKGAAVFLPFIAMLYCAVVFSLQLFDSFPPENYRLIPYLMIVMGVAFTLFMTIAPAKGLLFGFKDFDFLMSLPISRIDVMLSKLLSFLTLEYAYSGFYIIPSLIIYGVKTEQGALYYLYALIGFLFIPLIPIVIASLLAMLIKRFTAKSRFQSVFEAIAYFLLFVIAFGFGFISTTIDSIASIEPIINGFKTYIPFAYYYANSLVELNFLHLLISIGISLIVFAIFVIIFNKVFIKINSLGNEGYHVKNYHLNNVKKGSIDQILLKKELRRFLTNLPYLMNTAMGLIIVLIASIFAIFNRSAILQLVSELGVPQDQIQLVLVTVTLLIGMCSSISCTTGVSISLEGKNLWITKSLPITTNQVFISKAKVNIYMILIITIPSILLLNFTFNGGVELLVTCLIYIILVALFTALFGLVVNLNFPKLEFDREIVVIKQSASSFISIFTNLILSLAFLLGSIYLIEKGVSPMLLLGIIIGFYGLMSIILFVYLKKKGAQKFNQLQA